MAKKSINPIEQHVEKIVLGIAVLVLLAGGGYFLSGAPYKIKGWKNDVLTPAELGTRLKEDAELVRSRAAAAPQSPPQADIPSVEEVDDSANKAFGLLGVFPDVTPTIPTALPWPPPPIEGERQSGRKARPLVEVVAPKFIQVAMHDNQLKLGGTDTLQDILERPELRLTADTPWPGGGESAHWVMVAGLVDLSEELDAHRAADYPRDQFDLTGYDVQVERREVIRTDDGDVHGPWTLVNNYVPFAMPPVPNPSFAPDGRLTDRSELDQFWSLLRQSQGLLLRPPLPERVAGDRIEDPELPFVREQPAGFFDPADRSMAQKPEDPKMRQLSARWSKDAEKLATDPNKLQMAYVFAEAAYWVHPISEQSRKSALSSLERVDAAMTAAGGVVPTRELRRRMPVIAYDLTAMPRKMYQYRLRLRAVNRLAGRPYELANAADAKKVLIEGTWSEPSATVDIPADMYWYLTKVDGEGAEATIAVYRRERPRGSEFKKRNFKVKVGDMIGGRGVGRQALDHTTGSLVVAIDTNFTYYSPSGVQVPTSAVMCTDPNNPDRLIQLILARDDKDLRQKAMGG